MPAEDESVPLEASSGVFVWTEPDGWWWELEGSADVDGSTLRTVAEALQLETAPGGDQPLADLDPSDVPDGFEIESQVVSEPTPMADEDITWSVKVGDQAAGAGGIECYIDVDRPVSEFAFDWRSYAAGEIVTVNDEDAVWTSTYGRYGATLMWEVAPGVRAAANCVSWDDSGYDELDLDTHIRLAESFEPVEPDDPRLPG